MFAKMEGVEKGRVTDFSVANGTVTATLLAGPQVIVPYVGYPPGRGQQAYFFEVGGGSLMCIGAVSEPGWLGPWNAAWASVTETVYTSTQDLTTLADITGMTVTFTAVANRLYRLTIVGTANNVTAAGGMTLQIVTGLSGAGTVIANDQLVCSVVGQFPCIARAPLQTPTAGSVSFHARAAAGAGAFRTNGSASNPWTFSVDDMGPAGDPVLSN